MASRRCSVPAAKAPDRPRRTNRPRGHAAGQPRRVSRDGARPPALRGPRSARSTRRSRCSQTPRSIPHRPAGGPAARRAGRHLRRRSRQAANNGRQRVCATGTPESSADVPPVEMMHHAPCQRAIGSHDRDTLYGLLERIAHQQGDGLGLFLGVRAGHDPHPCHTPLLRGQVDPSLARFGRQEQRSERMAAFGLRRGDATAMPRLHFLACDPHAVEQQLEVVLRMRHRILACERRGAGFGRRPGAAQFVPHRLRHGEIEIGQDHRPLIAIGDHSQQPRKRRCGAGHARSDDGRFGRRSTPARGGPVEQAIAPAAASSASHCCNCSSHLA